MRVRRNTNRLCEPRRKAWYACATDVHFDEWLANRARLFERRRWRARLKPRDFSLPDWLMRNPGVCQCQCQSPFDGIGGEHLKSCPFNDPNYGMSFSELRRRVAKVERKRARGGQGKRGRR